MTLHKTPIIHSVTIIMTTERRRLIGPQRLSPYDNRKTPSNWPTASVSFTVIFCLTWSGRLAQKSIILQDNKSLVYNVYTAVQRNRCSCCLTLYCHICARPLESKQVLPFDFALQYEQYLESRQLLLWLCTAEYWPLITILFRDLPSVICPPSLHQQHVFFHMLRQFVASTQCVYVFLKQILVWVIVLVCIIIYYSIGWLDTELQ